MYSKENRDEQNYTEQLPTESSIDQAALFLELLDEYHPAALRRGQYVKGEILQIQDNVILADVDAKRTAVVPPGDIERLGAEDLAKLSVGDEVTLYVLQTPEGEDELLVSLNKGLEQQDWVEAEARLESDDLLELEVTGYNKGGLVVAFGHLRGFVPASHIPQLRHFHDERVLSSEKAKLVGQTLPLKAIEVNQDRGRLVLSAKKAQQELRQQRFLELKLMEGDVFRGHVTGLAKFGAFVDLGSVEGLIHNSEIAWENVERPGAYLSPGDEVDVLIQAVDVEQERVRLSRKALLPSPWDQFALDHAVDDLVESVVTNVVDFGAFAQVADGVEGLIHVSEMHGTRDIAPQDVLYPGDTLLVRILNIEPEKQRLALSQRRVSHNEEIEWIWQRQQQQTSLALEEEE